MDVARVIRMKSTVEAAAESGATHWEAVDTYNTMRAEVADALPEFAEELGRLFPHWEYRRSGGMVGRALNSIDSANEAQARMRRLAGWLNGLIQAARLQAEAEAYAKERVKAERGMGFQPRTKSED